ncbi:MAG: DUF308 domain-containing protein [Micromonosporaceae bacterium]
MTDRPLRRGRRDNGLDAAEYAPAADVDPRIGEHLLDVLGLAKIAAYLQPSSDLDPVTRSSMLPARPTDRLFVDREHLDEAREFTRRLESGDDPLHDDLAAEGGGLDDFETRWRDLVAQLESDSQERTDGASGEPAAGRDAGIRVGEKDFGLPRVRSALPDDTPEPTLLDALDADLGDEDDRFVPPNPPPLPSLSRPTVLSLAAVLAGLVVLIWPQSLTYLNIPGKDTAMVVATVLFIAGGIGLVLRLRPAPDDEDPDDGARV